LEKDYLEDTSKMDLNRIGYEDGTWLELAQHRVQCWELVICGAEPSTYTTSE